MMKIFVTGGTGFTGKRVLPLLKDKGEIFCLVRRKDQFPFIKKFGFHPVSGDVNDGESLEKSMQGFDGLINIVSLGFGHAGSIVSSALKAGIERALFVSTTAIETRLNAKTKQVRITAEKRIKESGLKWTILRPTMIYGAPDDRNIIKLLRFIKKMPLIPVPGDGKSLQQPVYVKDLANAIVSAFFSDRTIHKTYNISGKHPLTFEQLITDSCEAMNLRRSMIHIPIRPAALFFRWMEKMFKNPFLKEEQILRLLENKDFIHEEARQDFGFSPISFKDGIREETDLYLKNKK